MKIFLAVAVALCGCLPAFSGETSDAIKPGEIDPILEKAALIDDMGDEDINSYMKCPFMQNEQEQQSCLKTIVMRRYKNIFNVVKYTPGSSETEIRHGIALIVKEIKAQEGVLQGQKAFLDGVLNTKNCLGPRQRMEAMDMIENEKGEAIAYCIRYRGRDDNPPSSCVSDQFFGIRIRFKEKIEKHDKECAAALAAIGAEKKREKHMNAKSEEIKGRLSGLKTEWSAGDDEMPQSGVDIKHGSKPDKAGVNNDRNEYKPEKYKKVEHKAPPALGEESSGAATGLTGEEKNRIQAVIDSLGSSGLTAQQKIICKRSLLTYQRCRNTGQCKQDLDTWVEKNCQ